MAASFQACPSRQAVLVVADDRGHHEVSASPESGTADRTHPPLPPPPPSPQPTVTGLPTQLAPRQQTISTKINSAASAALPQQQLDPQAFQILPTPHSPGLRLQTTNLPITRSGPSSATIGASDQPNPASPAGMARSGSFSDNLSPGSAVSYTSSYSPIMGSLNKMTPLPSPLAGSDSPGPWNKYREALSRNPSLTRSNNCSRAGSVLVTSTGESVDTAFATQNQRKNLNAIRPNLNPSHTFPFNSPTSISNGKADWEAGSLAVPLSRSLSKNGHERSPSLPVFDARFHREKYLAQRRRTFSSAESSPALGSAASVSSVSSTDTATDGAEQRSNSRLIKKQKLESFEAKTVPGDKMKRWRGIRLLGQGAFSKVILATSEDIPEEVDRINDEGVVVDEEPVPLNPRKYVAVKIVEHGAAGSDSKERVESGLKRELDILKSNHHPCLIRLKAYIIEPKRALLVLPYCAGGDLFDVASAFPLEAPLIRRMFAEIVSAVRYLHHNGIVHRDVKLENVLVNLSRSQLASVAASPYDYPYPITTLTDVGLSRRVDFENDDLLTTRCGSDDYASPELIMGMPYDGRQTDAWALGVLLYALMEERLPFDPPPNAVDPKMRSKTAHRIARCEWKWVKLQKAPANVDIDVNGKACGYDEELEGGKRIVEGLLKRALKRWKVDAVGEDVWVKEAITVPITEFAEG
ncbi:kinase-like domain-containing protein [Geopyxis carbonaria]|nr:kinase-like domain-containing protein [Geopyxis carbonaria]